jgi:hypothetical protein
VRDIRQGTVYATRFASPQGSLTTLRLKARMS